MTRAGNPCSLVRSGLLPLALLLASSTSRAAQAPQEPAPEDVVAELLAGISEERLMSKVETLVGFGTRHTLSETISSTHGIGAARRWLERELVEVSRATGGRLEVQRQEFMARLRSRPSVVEAEVVNVFGYLPSRSQERSGRTYVVSGHYDSRASDPLDGESAAPGADDDASGCAVVLELARVLSGHEFDANIVFLFVGAEEQGLFGAKHFAARAKEDGVWIDGMITLDIVGGIERGDGLIDERTIRCYSAAEGLHSSSRELARSVDAACRSHEPGAAVKLVYRLDRFGRGGDHIPFHELGWPAVRLTEAGEHYDRQHQDVRVEEGRRYGDLAEFVSAPYMARVARVTGAALAGLALAPPPPTRVRMRAALRHDTEVRWEPVEGAAGYEVLWRDTTAVRWEGAYPAEGPPFEVPGKSADTHFFGVRAVSAAGYRSRAAIPNRP